MAKFKEGMLMNMTESLLQKLEEKMVVLLTEVEDARLEIQRLKEENIILRSKEENNASKLQDLLALLDAVNTMENPVPNNITSVNAGVASVKPVLVQRDITG